MNLKATKIVNRKKNHNGRNRLVAVFIDFEKAFEMASPVLILNELVEIGIKGNLLGWIKNYLLERQGLVTVDNVKSNIFNFDG